MKKHPVHTTEQLRGGAKDFCEVLGQIPSAFVWEDKIKAIVQGSLPVGTLQGLWNATLESSLLGIRVLNDFFAPRHNPTDISAFDYQGFVPPSKFLTDSEKKDIDKHIAHLTIQRTETSPKPWEIYDMLRRAHDTAATFLRFLLTPDGKQYLPAGVDVSSHIAMCEQIEAEMRRFLNQPKA